MVRDMKYLREKDKSLSPRRHEEHEEIKLRALCVSAIAPASPKAPTVGALPPASMQSFVVNKRFR